MIQKEAKKRMARYTKLRKTKPKKTMLKGLRPFSDKFQDSFSPKMIQEMKEKIETIVANNRVLDKKDLWLINHILKVIEFRSANWDKKAEILTEINRGEIGGHRLGFTEEEIRGANRVVLEKEKEINLETFIKKLKEIKERSKK